MIGLNCYTVVVKKFFRKEIKHSAFFQKNIKIPVVAGLLIKMRVSNNIMTMKMVLKVNDIEQSYTSYRKINKDENELEKELYKSFMYYNHQNSFGSKQEFNNLIYNFAFPTWKKNKEFLIEEAKQKYLRKVGL